MTSLGEIRTRLADLKQEDQMKPDKTTDQNELERVSEEVAGRLATLGIELTGRETPDEVTRISDAVDRYEAAVQSRGGDLMMDEPPPGSPPQPDDPHFALPSRSPDESVSAYLARLERVTEEVLRHRRDG